MNNFLRPARWTPLLKRKKILRDIMLMNQISDDFPIFLLIEPTNNCNLDCYFCPRKTSKKEIGYMDFELYKKIIDESSKFGRRIMIGLQKDGEPLLHPFILKMIEYAKDNHAAYVLHLATNALALNEDMAIGILNCGLDDLLISIDAATGVIYEKIKGKDELRQVEININRFLRLKRKLKSKKPFVRVKLIKTADNIEEIKLFKRKWQGSADWVEITDMFSWGEIKNIRRGYANKSSRYPCLFPWYWPAVNWNGDVSLCCYDFNSEGIMGNMREESLYEIWRNSKFRDFRYAHVSGDYDRISLCSKCKLWGMSPNLGNWLKRRFLENKGSI